MTEINYYVSLTDSQNFNPQVGFSGICKRIKFAWTAVMSADTKYIAMYIHPNSGTSISIGMAKFFLKILVNADGAPTTRNFNVLKYIENTNFYIDKADYILIRNESGSTQLGLLTLDIVPVTDKTRLALGGDYHNQ